MQDPAIGCIVLAGGLSRRMGGNKLTADLHGKAILLRVIDAALDSGVRPIIVVTGHQAAAVTESLAERDVVIIHNPDYADGQSTSLRAGIACLPSDLDGVAVLLGDMPDVRADTIDRLVHCFIGSGLPDAVVPVCSGQRGNPVILGTRLFAAVMTLTGDRGAKSLLTGDRVVEMETNDAAVLRDIDTIGDLEKARALPQA